MTSQEPVQSEERGSSTLGELLIAFSTVTSVGLGLGTDHGIRTCYIGVCLAADLELPPPGSADVYYAALMKDGGCTCGTSQMAAFLGADERDALADFVQLDPDNELQMLRWIFRHAGRGSGPVTRARRTIDALVHGARFERDSAIAECEVAQRVAERLGLADETRAGLTACTERWDGKGRPYGLAGDAIPLVARIINLSAAVEIAERLSGQDGAVAMVRQRSGKAFDPMVASAFLALAERTDFWAALDEDGLRERVLAMEPADRRLSGGADALDRFTTVLADLVDLKRPATPATPAASPSWRTALRLASGCRGWSASRCGVPHSCTTPGCSPSPHTRSRAEGWTRPIARTHEGRSSCSVESPRFAGPASSRRYTTSASMARGGRRAPRRRGSHSRPASSPRHAHSTS